MEVSTGFGMKNSTTLPRAANEYFNSLRNANDEPIYTYNDEYMRHFVRQSIEGGRCSASNECYKSSTSDEVFNIISTELNVKGNICEIIDKYSEFTNKVKKTFRTDFHSQFEDYRYIIPEERTEKFNDKLSKLPKHGKLKKLDLDNVMMDFEATSLYPSAKYDGKTAYPKIENGFAFKPHMNDVNVEAFKNKTINQDGNESIIHLI